jgi:hypothetical protein
MLAAKTAATIRNHLCTLQLVDQCQQVFQKNTSLWNIHLFQGFKQNIPKQGITCAHACLASVSGEISSGMVHGHI